MGEKCFKKLGILAVVVVLYFGGVVAVAAELAPKIILGGEGHLSPILGNNIKACEASCTTQEECMKEDCLGKFGVCKETSKTCSCNATVSVPSDDGLRCLATGVVKIGESCEKEEQCVGNPGTSSTCTKIGICGCMPGFPPSIKLDDCLTIQNKLGGPCKESHQCSLGKPGRHSECSTEGKCTCKSEAITEGDDDICYLKATLVGAPCEVDSQCTTNLGLSSCLNKTCECWPEAVPNGNGTHCHLKRNLGENCDVTGECQHIEAAVCSAKKKCECDEGYGRNPTENNSTCMKWATTIGHFCDKHESQCEKNLVNVPCMAFEKYFLCFCNSTQVESEDRKTCLPRRTSLNETCSEKNQCRVSNSNCNTFEDGTKKCGCADTYVEGVEISNRCLRLYPGPFYSCEEEVQCSAIGDPPGTVPCNKGNYCYCESPYYFYNQCVLPRTLGQACTLTDECMAGVNNMTWCAGDNGESDSKKWCQCKGENMTVVGGYCYQVKRVGDPCNSYWECSNTIGGSVGCEEEYVANGTVTPQTQVCSCLNGAIATDDGLRCSSNSPGLNSQMNIIIGGIIMAMATLTKFLN